jgi:hypothetical protein
MGLEIAREAPVRIELKETNFCVDGTLSSPYYEVERLRREGAEASRTMTSRTDALVNAGRWSRELALASARGLPVVSESRLSILLTRGWVEVEDPAPRPPPIEDTTLDGFIAHARGALAEPTSPELWGRLVALVDQAEPPVLGPLVDYVDAQVSRWSRRDQLCCALPLGWLPGLLNEHDSPAHRLVRRIDLSELDCQTGQLQAILAREQLTGARHLDLSGQNELTKEALRVVSSSPRLARLEHLALGWFEPSWAAELAAGDELGSLRSLGLSGATRDDHPTEERAYRALYRVPAVSRVARLVLCGEDPTHAAARALAPLDDPGVLPELRHLELDMMRFGAADGARLLGREHVAALLDALPERARGRVETLTLSSVVTGARPPSGSIDLTTLPRLHTLRLYALVAPDAWPNSIRQRLHQMMHAHRMKLPGSLERVVTNVPLDHRAFSLLAERRPDLELVYDPLPAPLDV